MILDPADANRKYDAANKGLQSFRLQDQAILSRLLHPSETAPTYFGSRSETEPFPFRSNAETAGHVKEAACLQ